MWFSRFAVQPDASQSVSIASFCCVLYDLICSTDRGRCWLLYAERNDATRETDFRDRIRTSVGVVGVDVDMWIVFEFEFWFGWPGRRCDFRSLFSAQHDACLLAPRCITSRGLGLC